MSTPYAPDADPVGEAWTWCAAASDARWYSRTRHVKNSDGTEEVVYHVHASPTGSASVAYGMDTPPKILIVTQH